MEKATRAIRRSGVRLKSMNSGHTDLALIVAGLRDMKVSMRALQCAHTTVAQDMMVWSHTDENRAIQDVMEQVNELHNFWADTQKIFLEQVQNFKHQFELILEGEKVIDAARANLAHAEQREYKIKKEMKKLVKKATYEEMMRMGIKLSDAERAKDLAQFEAIEKMQENEACKLIRLKEGLTKLSEGYIEMAHKMAIIFDAQKEVVQALPDVHDSAIHELKYTGGGFTQQAVHKAKNRLEKYHTLNYRLVANGVDEPPPPYTPGYYDPATGLPYEQQTSSNGVRLRPARRVEPRVPPLEEERVTAREDSSDEEDLQRLGAHKL